MIDVKSLGYGIVLAGCASELNNLPELIQERFKINVRHSTIRSSLLNGDSDMMGNPLYMTAVSLMLKGTEPCVSHPLASQEPVGGDDKEDEDKDGDRREKPRGGFIKRSRRKKPAPVPDADAKDADADPGDAGAGKPEGKNGKKGNSLGRFIGELFSDES